jgi:uncharacterized protein YcfJ
MAFVVTHVRRIGPMRLRRLLLLGFPLLLAAATAPIVAAHAQESTQQPKPEGGTLKGAAVGALAGHELGDHTKTGAVAGAIVGHHEKAESEKRIEDSKQQQP